MTARRPLTAPRAVTARRPATAAPVPSIERLNALPADEAAAALAPLFEGAPRFLARLVGTRPWASADGLFTAAEAVAGALPEDEAVELVDAHPRLGAPPGAVSAASFAEQGYDRGAGPIDVAAELERLNDAYETRFGFRYCVFVAGRPRVALLPGFRAALDADRSAELRRGARDVVAIARDRYARQVPPANEVEEAT